MSLPVPEIQRKIAQHDEDIMAIYDMLTRVEHKVDGHTERLDGIDGRLAGIDGRLGGMDGRLAGMDGRLGGMDGRLDGMESQLATIIQILEQR